VRDGRPCARERVRRKIAQDGGRPGQTAGTVLTPLPPGNLYCYARPLPRASMHMDEPISLPQQPTVEWQLLRLLHQSRSLPIQQAYRELAVLLKLTTQQRNLVMSGVGRENAFENRCRFSRRRLVDRGWMSRSPKGIRSITEEGDQIASVRGSTYQSYTLTLEQLGL